MKFKSPVYSQASRSIAGITYSHNRGGMYTRARAIPTNPNTPLQQAVKAIMASISSRYILTLTAAQRASWDTYATQTPIVDSLGELRNIGAIGMYNRSNIVRLQGSAAVADDAPTVFDLGTFTPLTINTLTAALFKIAFTNTDAWASTAGGYAFIYVSLMQNPSINYYKGPFRFVGRIVGSGTPPTSPATLTLPYTAVVGRKIFVQYRISQADGRLSLPVILAGTVA